MTPVTLLGTAMTLSAKECHARTNYSLLDIGVGFLFVWGWIVYRERSPLRAIGWIVGILIMGNIASALYVVLAAHGSGGDWHRF